MSDDVRPGRLRLVSATPQTPATPPCNASAGPPARSETPSGANAPDTAPPPAPPTAVATVPAPMSDQERFELLVANDVEHERQLLYRALVVVELIGALILVREMLLWWTLS